MRPILRREVVLPLRAHHRAPFCLGVASLLVTLLILLDAAFCSHPASRPAARTPTSRAAVHLHRPPCRARRPAALDPQRAALDPPPAAAPDPQLEVFQEEFRRDAARQLARPWAAADYPEPAGLRSNGGMLHAPHMPAP